MGCLFRSAAQSTEHGRQRGTSDVSHRLSARCAVRTVVCQNSHCQQDLHGACRWPVSGQSELEWFQEVVKPVQRLPGTSCEGSWGDCWPARWAMLVLGMKSYQRTPRMQCWHVMWNASDFHSSHCSRVHVSAPYKWTETKKVLYSCSFVIRLNLCCRQTLLSVSIMLAAKPVRVITSNVEWPEESMSLPRYVKHSVTSTACPWMCVGGGAESQPIFCSYFFIHEVCRPIICAALSKPASISGQEEPRLCLIVLYCI